MCCIVGKFFGKRIKTIFNVETNCVNEYFNDIECLITQITEHQYLMKQTNLESGSIVYLMFFKSDTDYLSSSDSGIDNLFFNEFNELVHNWSIPINSENNLTNAHTVLYRI